MSRSDVHRQLVPKVGELCPVSAILDWLNVGLYWDRTEPEPSRRQGQERKCSFAGWIGPHVRLATARRLAPMEAPHLSTIRAFLGRQTMFPSKMTYLTGRQGFFAAVLFAYSMTFGCSSGDGAMPKSSGGSEAVASGGTPSTFVQSSGGAADGGTGTGGLRQLPSLSTCDPAVPGRETPERGDQHARSIATDVADFYLKVSRSEVVETVGIVEWGVSRSISSAWIEFGRAADAPEYFAPVDLGAPALRTLLLGMKSGERYVARVVASGCSGELYVSEDIEFDEGYLPNGMPMVTVTNVAAGEVFEGFTVTCNGYGNLQGMEMVGASSWAMIIDHEGDYVWGLELDDTPLIDCSQARMSHDGRHLWLGNTSTIKPTGVLRRMTLDGLEVEDFSLPARHHDFTVLPNGNILYFEQQNGGGVFDETEGPDSVYELDPNTGQSILIYDQTTDFADLIEVSGGAHTNGITYVPHLQAFSFSMLFSDTIALLSYPDAQLLGVFSGSRDEFGVSWNAQHGHQFLKESFLVFNNWSNVGDSALLEFPYDLGEKTTGIRDYYSPDPSIGTTAFGGVQRVPGGNTIVTFSSNGVIHEVSPSKQLLVETKIGAVLGYATRRATLYGPPPHLMHDL